MSVHRVLAPCSLGVLLLIPTLLHGGTVRYAVKCWDLILLQSRNIIGNFMGFFSSEPEIMTKLCRSQSCGNCDAKDACCRTKYRKTLGSATYTVGVREPKLIMV